jgi:1-aminocyclopropane-1-carboxylate deaminase/D-cysteine desulfhydrase-like pyridoxal-dependent ACC family enzyme
VYVKREDMCLDDENYPPFSKVRGLFRRIEKLKAEGYTTFGYTESAVSMAGWGVAYVCKKLDVKAVIYNPVYKHDDYRGKEILELHRIKWKEFGAIIKDIPASMVKVNYNICRKHLAEMYPYSTMLPLGLPFEETIEETAQEYLSVKEEHKSIVVCVGSGTITAGLLRATNKPIYGIMSRTGSVDKMKSKIKIKSGMILDRGNNLHVIDPGWEYTEKSEAVCPFPSHPYYDLKAWQWLNENIQDLPQPVLFWNIGRKV